jgi:hypothetical protein
VSEPEIAFLSLIVGIITGVFGILSVIYAARMHRISRNQLLLQERTLSAQNVFVVPQLSCALISEQCPEKVMIAVKIPKGRVVEVSMPIVITNKSPKTAEHVFIYFRMPKELAYNNQIKMLDSKESWIKLKKAEMAFLAQENFSTFVLSMPRFAQHEKLEFSIPISLRRDSMISDVVSATSKDKVPFKIPYSLIMHYRFTIIYSCEGVPAGTKTYSIEIVNTNESSLKEIIDKRNFDRIAEQRKSNKKPLLKRVMETIIFLWSGDYKKDWLPKFFVVQPSEKYLVRDKRQPIDRYRNDNGLLYEGVYDKRKKTYWIPAIRTTFFGEAAPIPIPKEKASH